MTPPWARCPPDGQEVSVLGANCDAAATRRWHSPFPRTGGRLLTAGEKGTQNRTQFQLNDWGSPCRAEACCDWWFAPCFWRPGSLRSKQPQRLRRPATVTWPLFGPTPTTSTRRQPLGSAALTTT